MAKRGFHGKVNKCNIDKSKLLKCQHVLHLRGTSEKVHCLANAEHCHAKEGARFSLRWF